MECTSTARLLISDLPVWAADDGSGAVEEEAKSSSSAMLGLLVPAIPGFDHRLSDLSSLEIHQVGDELAQVHHRAHTSN